MPSEQAIMAARALIDAEFGFGRTDAHEILRANGAARRIYDCSVMALARVLEPSRGMDFGIDLGSVEIQAWINPDGSVSFG